MGASGVAAAVKASVIIVVHAGRERLDDSVASLAGLERRADTEVIVVDNGSSEALGEEARRRFPWVHVVREETNLGFAGGVCRGVEVASGEVLLLLNDDAAAAPEWLDAHLDALASRPEAAASAGRLVSWDGSRNDFVRGVVTFDAHAFQLGQGRHIEDVAVPEVGEPLPFACGGNLAVRRADWDLVGGFDPNLFAYFEDVELGWRLWAAGRPVIAAPSAIARHRGMTTSNAFGNYRRGVLFERNALRVFFACADDEHRAALGAAVLVTFLHRLAAFAAADPAMAGVLGEPFRGDVGGKPGHGERRREVNRRGVGGALRHLISRVTRSPREGEPCLDDGLLLMQLQAAEGFLQGLDRTTVRRRELEDVRRIPDREILARFPRLIVPAYTGDAEWFSSDGFRELLPAGWPLQERALEDIIRRADG